MFVVEIQNQNYWKKQQVLTWPKTFGVILAQSSFSFPSSGPRHWCGDPGLSWALAIAKQGAPQTALPSIPLTQSLCLYLPRAPCTPAETNSASSRCRAFMPGIYARTASCFHALTECPPSPYLENISNYSLIEGFPDLLHNLVTPFVSSG